MHPPGVLKKKAGSLWKLNFGNFFLNINIIMKKFLFLHTVFFAYLYISEGATANFEVFFTSKNLEKMGFKVAEAGSSQSCIRKG